MTVRIVDVCEITKPISSPIRNAYIDFTRMTTSLVAVVTDVVRDGRPVVVVLGMHRSGTSLLSNVLQFLGVDMADTTDHTSPKNAGGFWERPELVAIHDEILAAIGRPIGVVRPWVPWSKRLSQVQAVTSTAASVGP